MISGAKLSANNQHFLAFIQPDTNELHVRLFTIKIGKNLSYHQHYILALGHQRQSQVFAKIQAPNRRKRLYGKGL